MGARPCREGLLPLLAQLIFALCRPSLQDIAELEGLDAALDEISVVAETDPEMQMDRGRSLPPTPRRRAATW